MSNTRNQVEIPRISYIATEEFSNSFLTYNETFNTLSKVTNDTNLCPKGRILRENGKKIFPGVNPGIKTYLVGVYDSVTFLKGFIDPNSHCFSLFNPSKPLYLDTDIDSEHGSINDNNSEGPDLGMPVYTRGNIETIEGRVVAGDIEGSYVMLDALSGNVTMTGLLYPTNTVGTVTLNSGVAVINNNLLSLNPTVFLTRKAASGNIGELTYDIDTTAETLTINSTSNTDNSVVNYILIGV